MLRMSVFILVGLVIAVMLTAPDDGISIPAFARKYSFSCSTCHLAVPKLKEYGDDFAGNGFQLPDADEPVRAFKDVGDPDLLLQRDLPVAIRFDAYARYRSEGDINNDWQTPYGVKLLSGGNIAKDIGYYFYFYMNERGEVAGLEDAYVHFNNIRGTQLDIMLGQFQICDPLMKRELRLTYEDYKIYTISVGRSLANLKYDRGVIVTYSLPTQTDLTLEIVNGNGIGEAEGTSHLFDNDNNKNVFGKIAQNYSIFTVGVFGYAGTEEMMEGNDAGNENQFYMAGPDISVGTDHFEVTAQYVTRNDDNPDFADDSDDYTTEGFIGELVLNPFPEKSKLFGVVLYNQVTSDYPGLEYETITGSVSYLYKTNMRFLGEVTYDIENEESQIVFGTMTGF